jgi:outer membrane protein TolC
LSISTEKTLLNNQDIQSFILKTELSQKNYDVTFADNLPQINLQGEYDFSQTYTSSANGTFYTKEKDGWYSGASLKQKIWFIFS